jgi:hypothetical protein
LKQTIVISGSGKLKANTWPPVVVAVDLVEFPELTEFVVVVDGVLYVPERDPPLEETMTKYLKPAFNAKSADLKRAISVALDAEV